MEYHILEGNVERAKGTKNKFLCAVMDIQGSFFISHTEGHLYQLRWNAY